MTRTTAAPHHSPRATFQKPALVIEIVGPAGVGKTTLVRALEQHLEVAVGVHPRRVDYLPFLLGDAPLLLPTVSTRILGKGWFTRDELRSAAYLRAWHQALVNTPPDTITCLDQGPVFKLALLREFGSKATEHSFFRRWWAEMLARWAAKLRLIVWLDAPDAVLVERINSRDKDHPFKGKGNLEVLEFLGRFRNSFAEVITEMTSQNGPELLHLDTHERPLDEAVACVITMLSTLTHGDQPLFIMHQARLKPPKGSGLL